MVQELGLGGWPAPDANSQNLDHPRLLGLRETQHITGFHRCRRFGNAAFIKAQIPPLDQSGTQRAGFKKPRVPKPFVDAQGWGGFAQLNLCL